MATWSKLGAMLAVAMLFAPAMLTFLDAEETVPQAAPAVLPGGSQGRSEGRAAGDPSMPDIVLSNLSWSLSSPDDGAAVTLLATVFNDGQAVNRRFSVRFYIDGKNAGSSEVSALPESTFTTVKMAWTAVAGTHEVRALADASNAVAEANETNNFRIAFIDISYPDVVVDNVTWYPRDYRDGDPVTITATVRNIGRGNSTRSFVIGASMDQEELSNCIVGGLGSNSTALVIFPWKARPGNHTMFIAADTGAAVRESNEANNRKTVIFGEDYPDLTITSMSTASNLTDGAPAALCATVKNAGRGSTTQMFSVSFCVDGYAIGSAMVYGLASNSSRNVSVTWNARAGGHDLRAFVDSTFAVSESVESNNYRMSQLSVPYPELTIRNLRWAPALPFDGKQVYINVTVGNKGPGPTLYQVPVWFWMDGVTLGTMGLEGGLAAGTEKNISTKWTATPGHHELRAAVDPENGIPELDETNNSVFNWLDVPYPDLTLSNLTFTPQRPAAGDTVTLRASVRNLGPGNTSRDFKVLFTVGNREAGEVWLEGLNIGSVRNITATWTARAGTYDIVATVDGGKAVSEKEELNNIASTSIDIPYPDLTVLDLTWSPANATANMTLNLSVLVRNNGPGNLSAPFRVALFACNTFVQDSIINGLAANTNISINFSYRLRSNSSLLRVEADSYADVHELCEANNNLSRYYPNTTVVPAPAAPEITFGELKWYPEKPLDGESVMFIATVATTNMSTQLHAGVDVAFIIDGKLEGTRRALVSAGEGVATLDWTAGPGSHAISVIADPDDSYNELRTDNNILRANMTVQRADILVTSLAPTSPTAIDGNRVMVFAGIINNGAATRRTLSISLFLDGIRTQTMKQVGLANGTASTLMFCVTASPGDHRLCVVADPGGELNELDETNNHAVSQVSTGRPDIVVSGIHAIQTADEGNSVTLSANLTNRGADTLRDMTVDIMVDGLLVGREPVGGIASGKSASVSRQWSATPGRHNITVIADTSSAAGELDETNNRLTSPGANVSMPELSMRNLTLTQPPVDGAECLLSAELANTGAATLRDITIGFYVDGRLVRTSKVGGMLDNSSMTVSVRFNLRAGPHRLAAVADTQTIVPEQDETNNGAFLDTDGPQGGEITMSGLKVPPTAVDGETVGIFAELVNSGPGNFTVPFTVSFFIDGEWIEDVTVDGLPAGGTAPVSVRWTASPGKHDVRAIADSENVLPEANEADNDLHTQGMDTEHPDFLVSSISSIRSASQMGSDAFTIFSTVENIGGHTLRRVPFSIYLDNTLLGTIRVSGLSARNSTQLSMSASATGSHLIGVTADAANELAEGDESNNNARADLVPVAEAPGTRPDLLVTALQMVPEYPTDGESVTIFATVTNEGNASLTKNADAVLIVNGVNASHATITGLLPGGTCLLSFDWTARGGRSSVKVKVDPSDKVVEWDESDNQFTTFVEALLPDLRVAELIRWNCTEGLANPLFLVVENNGTGDTLRLALVDVYIGGMVHSKHQVRGLLSGEKFAIPVKWLGISGDNDIVITIDPLGEMPESDKSNNQLTDVVFSKWPDLSVERIDWTPHRDGENTLTIFVTVQNTGTGAVGNSFYVDLQVDHIPLSRKEVSGLPADSRTVLAWKWDIAPGNHTFTAMADYTDSVWEPNENNNRYELEFPSRREGAMAPVINLRLANMTYHQSNNNSKNLLTFTITLDNDGEENLTATALFFIVNGLILDELPVPALKENSTFILTHKWYAPTSNLTVRVVADGRREVLEDFETDNDFTIQIEANRPPVAVSGGTRRIEEGDTVRFHGIGIDYDGYISLYEWDLNGDGVYELSSTTTGDVEKIFHTKGKYTVSLRITDDLGATAVSTSAVQVKAKQQKTLLNADIMTFAAIIVLTAILVGIGVAIYRGRGDVFRQK